MWPSLKGRSASFELGAVVRGNVAERRAFTIALAMPCAGRHGVHRRRRPAEGRRRTREIAAITSRRRRTAVPRPSRSSRLWGSKERKATRLRHHLRRPRSIGGSASFWPSRSEALVGRWSGQIAGDCGLPLNAMQAICDISTLKRCFSVAKRSWRVVCCRHTNVALARVIPLQSRRNPNSSWELPMQRKRHSVAEISASTSERN